MTEFTIKQKKHFSDISIGTLGTNQVNPICENLQEAIFRFIHDQSMCKPQATEQGFIHQHIFACL